MWDGQVEPLNTARLAKETDLTFLAVPEQAAAELAPPLVDAGVRVIDLSGAFRIRERRRAHALVSRRRKTCRPASAYGLTEFFKDDVRDGAARGQSRLLSDGRAAVAAAARRRPACSTPKRASSSTRSPASPAPAARRAIARTSPRITDRCAAYGVFNHRHVAEMEQELGATVTFVPHLVPLDRGILETIYVKVAPGTTAEQIADAYQQVVPRRAVRPAHRRRAAGNQARRVDEFLRHRLAVRCRRRAGSSSCRASTIW